MKYLALLFLFVMPARAQDSLAVSLPAWDIDYHVFSGNYYLKLTHNPYGEGQAIFVYETKYLRAIHVRIESECVTYTPTRRRGLPALQKVSAGCRMFNYLSTEVQRYIDGQESRPLEKI